MSLCKERFVHINPSYFKKPDLKFSGATIRLAPDIGDVNNEEKKVWFSVAMCSLKDNFCRAQGREWARKKPPELVAVTSIPMRIAEIEEKVYGFDINTFSLKEKRRLANQFAWIWKYFL